MTQKFFTFLIPLVLCTGTVFNTLRSENEVRFQILSFEDSYAPGDELVLTLRANIAPSWHLYSATPYPEDVLAAPQPTQIQLEESLFLKPNGPIRQPQPKKDFDENFGIETEYFEGIADFEIPIRIAPNALKEEHTIVLKVRFMACNDRLCLPPQNVKVSNVLSVSKKSSNSSIESPQIFSKQGSNLIEDSEDNIKSVKSLSLLNKPKTASDQIPTGLLSYLLFAMAGAGLALLTPCVFPMIPITVSYFTKREVGKTQALYDAALYSFGIILTFTLIGLFLTWLFGVGGINRVATSPVANIAIAILFIVFALSLFGAIEIRLPSSWLTAVDKTSSNVGSVVGILLMALAFSLTSFTCTVPFVGTVMVAAARGNWGWSLLGIGAFSTVFAAPFFLLALFPSWLKSLPKSGSWMNSLKVILGFLELAAALKFLSNVDLVYQLEIITRPVFISVWLTISLILVLYLLRVFSFGHEPTKKRLGVFRTLSSVFFLSVSCYLLRGFFGAPLGELEPFIPPRDYGFEYSELVQSTSENSLGQKELSPWLSNYEKGLQLAKDNGKPVFIDFTGYTCTNCRWMEANIFTRPKIRQLLGKYNLVRLYTDGTKPEHVENLEMERDRFQTIALPLYALMTPNDEIIDTFQGLNRNEQEFVLFLEQGINLSD